MTDVDELTKFRTEWRNEVQRKAKEHARHSSSPAKEPLPQLAKSGVDSGASQSAQTVSAPAPTITPSHKPRPVLFKPDAPPEESKAEFSKPLSAMQIYEKGVEKERQGLLSDALIFYRRAFKLDANIDRVFRDAYRAGEVDEARFDNAGSSIEETNYAKFIQTGHDYEPDQSYETPEQIEEMIRMMAAIRMPVEAEDTSRPSGISLLPEEILHQILTYVVVNDSSRFTSLSLTCQKLFVLLHDESIWRDLCIATYQHQVYTGEEIAVGSDSEYSSYMDKVLAELSDQYKGDWKRMFIEKPRIRMEGCYIATCHYTRPGVREESLVWTSPFHLVTYFRFLRFFSNGDCLSLLTTAEPRDVVHQITPGTKLKGVQRGRWSISRKGELSIKSSGPANYTFFMELQIKSSSRGRQNKLSWSQFYGVHPLSSEITTFNLKNDRAFYYSRVGSYNK